MTRTFEEIFSQTLDESNQKFPEIEQIEPVLTAIEDHKEFCVHRYGGYRVIDYKTETNGTFPEPTEGPNATTFALRRECRGLIFDPNGMLCCRKFHKFFQINQRPESTVKAIDWSAPFHILEKLDGTLVAPAPWEGHIIWTTRGGPSPIAQQAANWVARQPSLQETIASIVACGWTPLFEWCSRQHPIALDYPECQLVLIAIRHNRSGTYLPFPTMQQLAAQQEIPCVPSFGLLHGQKEAQEFLAKTFKQTDGEGYILRADDGRLFKVKTKLYSQLHQLHADARPELSGWQMAFQREVAPLFGKLHLSIHTVLLRLEHLLDTALTTNAEELSNFIETAKATIQAEQRATQTEREESPQASAADARKIFAQDWFPRWQGPKQELLFRIWDGQDAKTLLRDLVQQKLQSVPGLKDVRKLLGITAKDILSLYREIPDISAETTNTPSSKNIYTEEAIHINMAKKTVGSKNVSPQTDRPYPIRYEQTPNRPRHHSPKRTLIVGDVHGCLDELKEMLSNLAFDGDDRLVLLGDIIDHGPDSLGVIEFLCGLRRAKMDIVLVQGNHEARLLENWYSYSFRKQVEGIVEEEQELPKLSPWVHEITPEGWEFLQGTHLFYPLPEHEALVVHAGIPSTRHVLPLTSSLRDLARNQHRSASELQYLRYERREGSHIRGIIPGHEKAGDWYWAQRYDGRLGHVFYGHHPYLQAHPQQWPHATGIDLGCVIGGALAVAILTQGTPQPEFAIFPAKRVYSPPHNVEQWADVRLGLVPMPTLLAKS